MGVEAAAGETPSLTEELAGQTHRGPRTYTKPPTWESEPEGPNLLVGSGEVTESQQRVEQTALFPLGPLPHIQHHNTAMWVALPWQVPKALPFSL